MTENEDESETDSITNKGSLIACNSLWTRHVEHLDYLRVVSQLRETFNADLELSDYLRVVNQAEGMIITAAKDDEKNEQVMDAEGSILGGTTGDQGIRVAIQEEVVTEITRATVEDSLETVLSLLDHRLVSHLDHHLADPMDREEEEVGAVDPKEPKMNPREDDVEKNETHGPLAGSR